MRKRFQRWAALGVVSIAMTLAGCADLVAWLGPDAAEREPDVVYDPTTPEVVDAMLTLAAPRPGDVLYDLGSGDGRIVVAAAQRYGIRGIGLEVDPDLIARANENARRAGVSALVEFRKQDLFTADFRDATIVTLFLGAELNLKLRPRLLQDLAPGARVLSHEYGMGLWKPEIIQQVGLHTIYFWTVPAR